MLNNNINTNTQSIFYRMPRKQPLYNAIDQKILTIPNYEGSESIDAEALAKELNGINNTPEIEKEKRGSMSPRMEWVQAQLKKMHARYEDVSLKLGYDNIFSSYVTMVPFISDFSKPVVMYVAGTNQHIKCNDLFVDRTSSVILALSLISKLMKSKEPVNVVVLFQKQYDRDQSADLIDDIIQRRILKTSVGSIIELGVFHGPEINIEGSHSIHEDSIVEQLINRSNLTKSYADESGLMYSSLVYNEYMAMVVSGLKPEEEFEILQDSNNIYNKDLGLDFCTLPEFEEFSQLLYKHAVITSSLYEKERLDYFYKH